MKNIDSLFGGQIFPALFVHYFPNCFQSKSFIFQSLYSRGLPFLTRLFVFIDNSIRNIYFHKFDNILFCVEHGFIKSILPTYNISIVFTVSRYDPNTKCDVECLVSYFVFTLIPSTRIQEVRHHRIGILRPQSISGRFRHIVFRSRSRSKAAQGNSKTQCKSQGYCQDNGQLFFTIHHWTPFRWRLTHPFLKTQFP